MAGTLLDKKLIYENKWIRLRETGNHNNSDKLIFKEIRQELINIAESWKKEKYLKNLLDTVLHLEEYYPPPASENQKLYHIPRGSSLLHLIEENKITIPERLKIASDIINITLELHNKEYLFCDLNPNLFWCDLIDEKIYLVDTIMTAPSKGISEFYSTIMGIDPHMLCMAPEQSFHTPLIPDYRANYYSIGIILYALFTGKFPLESHERISTIHKHLTQLPQDPKSINKDINPSMSNFILKLLTKDPRDRYQSATGLLYDFRKCKSLQLKKDKKTSFELGSKDFPIKFNIPDSVFLRQEAHQNLLDLSKKMSYDEKHLALIKAEEGSGVSYLIKSFFKELNYIEVFIGSGVYSPKDNIPFKGLKDVTSELLHQILMEEPALIEKLKRSMEENIGSLSGVLIDFEKDFEYLFESHQIPDELQGNAAINRFIYAYTEFLRLLQSLGKSIIISLERFELADIGTTRLIAQLLKSSFLQRIIVLVQVNKNENIYNANCVEFLESLERNFDGQDSINTKHIVLNTLDREEIDSILQSLKIEPRVEFGKILFEKTRGNISFLKQFFEELITQEYIKAIISKKIWEVDVHAVQSIDLSNNVKEFLKNRLNQLKEKELEVLKGAMTMGQNIEVRHLHYILSFEEELIDDYIESLRQKGFLVPLEYQNARLSKLKFSHSSFSEILQETMTQEEIESFKLNLVKALFKELNEDQIDSRLYELVSHIMPLNPEIGFEYSSYLEKAAYKAKKEAAFENASQYFSKLFEINKTQKNFESEKIFTNAYEAALCALYAMNYKKYKGLLVEIENVITTKEQGYRIYILKAIETLQQENHKATLKVLKAGLNEMGVQFNLKISKVELIKLFFLNLWQTRNMKVSNVENLPNNTDSLQSIYHELMNISAPAVYFLKPELVSRLTYLGLRDMINKGLIAQSPYNFISFGFTMNCFSNMVSRANEMCMAGFKLAESRVVSNEGSVPVNFLYCAFIQHTKDPLKLCISSLEENYKKGRELGNINIAHYSLGMNRWYLLFDGFPLVKLTELLDASHKLCLIDNQKLIDGFHKLIKTLVQELTRGYFYKEVFEDPKLPLTKIDIDSEEITGDRILLANAQMIKLIVDAGNNKICEDDDFLKSLLNSVLEGGHGSFNAIYHIFYGLMHLFKRKSKNSTIPKAQIKKFMEVLKVRSKFAPRNYKVKYLLLLGLREVQKGKSDIAKNYYSEAYDLAINSDNPWDKALCCEIYGELLLTRGLRQSGLKRISEAAQYYQEWGAISIVNRIYNQYPELSKETTVEAKETDVSFSLEQIDQNYNHLIRLSRSVYEQEDLNTLVEILFDAISEETSVEKIVFIINNELDFKIYASKEFFNEAEVKNISADASSLPLTLLRFVERRKTHVILGNASSDSQHRGDPYIEENKTKSALCIPFVRGNQTKGLIYFENNQLENAFEFTDVDFISLMYSQIAVAMDNSVLTELLEERLEQRSLQYSREKEKTDNLITNILPAKVAEELKIHGKVKARKYDNVSVLFTDFKDFTLFSEKLSADQIIEELDDCFRFFDSITEEFGLEKIKTIGDAYMCAGGIPDYRPSHEYDIVNAGLKMLAYIEESNKERSLRGIPTLHLRVGIHTGPLIAGVVGSMKYAYDIWGPTVNIASRMESSGVADMLNISGSLFMKVKDQFSCSYRGKIYAKNVGEIDMYFVENRR